tara:strand:+ start:189 stop:827 length:639 start_codon:yes stop_codon:yes gene_type:complete
MEISARRDKEKQIRRESILDAAESIFFSKGFANSSMGEIAKQAQLSRALLYVYFKDKAAIMRGVMLRAALTLEEYFSRALQAGTNGSKQIDGIGHAYYAFSKEQTNYFNVLMQLTTFPESKADNSQVEEIFDCRERITALMEEALRNGVQDGSLNAAHLQDTSQTAYFLQGALHGVIMATRTRYTDARQAQDGEALVLYTIAMLTESMRRRD